MGKFATLVISAYSYDQTAAAEKAGKKGCAGVCLTLSSYWCGYAISGNVDSATARIINLGDAEFVTQIHDVQQEYHDESQGEPYTWAFAIQSMLRKKVGDLKGLVVTDRHDFDAKTAVQTVLDHVAVKTTALFVFKCPRGYHACGVAVHASGSTDVLWAVFDPNYGLAAARVGKTQNKDSWKLKEAIGALVADYDITSGTFLPMSIG
jgi:hypothetical protein